MLLPEPLPGAVARGPVGDGGSLPAPGKALRVVLGFQIRAGGGACTMVGC